MSHVEVFATGIKIEWSDKIKVLFASQSKDQGNLWTLKIKGSRMCGSNSTFDPWNIKQSRVFEGLITHQVHFLLIKNLDPGCKRFNRRHISDYPLPQRGRKGCLGMRLGSYMIIVSCSQALTHMRNFRVRVYIFSWDYLHDCVAFVFDCVWFACNMQE